MPRLFLRIAVSCLLIVPACTTINFGPDVPSMPTWDYAEIVPPGHPSDEGNPFNIEAEFNAAKGTLTVSLEHPDERPTDVKIYVMDGANDCLISESGEHHFPTGIGSYEFEVAFFGQDADDRNNGQEPEAQINAIDDQERRSWLNHHSEVDMSYYYAPGAIYAIPFPRTVRAGEEVTVVLATGALDDPILYLNGARLAVDPGAEYVQSSFRPGFLPFEPHATEPSGVWTAAGLGVGFLLQPDSLIRPRPLPDGRNAFDFTIAPLRGSEFLGKQGTLCHFRLRFDEPGEYRLWLQEADEIPRTYFSGADTNVLYFWDDVSNDTPGIPNTVTVLE